MIKNLIQCNTIPQHLDINICIQSTTLTRASPSVEEIARDPKEDIYITWVLDIFFREESFEEQ